MKTELQQFFTFALLLILILSNFKIINGCADSYIAPVFQYKYAPENPFENFAARKIGILKPTYRRVVLFAAYRYLNEQSFSADEQKALVEVWNAEFKNEAPTQTENAEVVKKWLGKRKEIFSNEKEPPAIYRDRKFDSEDYSFFPNCSSNAFEVASDTLSDRISRYGAEDKNVSEWLKAQDTVFENCAGGSKIPAAPDASFPEWLRKDREYQIAAAYFYATNFEEAKKRFEEIAADSDSIWHETAEYLVGRTLVRQAGFTKDVVKRGSLYEEAENRLNNLPNGKFSDAARKLVNLIKLRQRPEERTRELAQNLLFQQTGENLRQDLIDYTWLLDKFETQALKNEEKRKEDEEIARFAESDNILKGEILSKLSQTGISVEVQVLKGEVTLRGQIPAEKAGEILAIVSYTKTKKIIDNLIRVTNNPDGSITYQGGGNEFSPFYDKKAKEQWEAIYRGELINIRIYDKNYRRFVFSPDLTDDEIYEQISRDFSDISKEEGEKIRTSIREARAEQIKNKFSSKPQPDYEGGYLGKERLNLQILPEFLRSDELTDWLFTFQTEGETTYLHALDKWGESKSNLWLVTTLSKAKANSKDLEKLLKAAEKVDFYSLAYPTVAYHKARIFIEQNKRAEAAKLLDEILASSLDLPVSTRNEFAEMRMQIAETLETFLKNATRKPFTFADYEKSVSIDEVIENQKAWWTENFDQTKDEWDKGIEDSYSEFKIWEKRELFDEQTVTIINEQFSLAVLLEAQKSSALPDYLRKRLAIVIWTRAVILNDDAVLQKIAPEILKIAPEAQDYLKAKTPEARRLAALFVIFRNDEFVPFLQSGFNRGYATFSEANGWWCEISDYDYDEDGNKVSRKIPVKPGFLTAEQSSDAQTEMKKISESGGAPVFLAAKAKEWLKTAPKDKRLPEVLYNAIRANEEFQYGCGNTVEKIELMNLLEKYFPASEWTQKLKNKFSPN